VAATEDNEDLLLLSASQCQVYIAFGAYVHTVHITHIRHIWHTVQILALVLTMEVALQSPRSRGRVLYLTPRRHATGTLQGHIFSPKLNLQMHSRKIQGTGVQAKYI
jgi:hypothetical protein